MRLRVRASIGVYPVTARLNKVVATNSIVKVRDLIMKVEQMD